MTTDAPIIPRPNPIDVALAALSEVAADLLTGNRPSRFAEIQMVSQVAQSVQRLRSAEHASVDDMGLHPNGQNMPNLQFGGVIGGPPVMPMPRWNDGMDLNTQLIMLAQKYLDTYVESEKTKRSRPDPDVRLNVVGELAELMELRIKLFQAAQEVPEEVNFRIDCLLKQIGEPPHGSEPEPSPVVPADPLRGHPPDGPGQPDGSRVGEPLAE